jgi:hypothetical protein
MFVICVKGGVESKGALSCWPISENVPFSDVGVKSYFRKLSYNFTHSLILPHPLVIVREHKLVRESTNSRVRVHTFREHISREGEREHILHTF